METIISSYCKILPNTLSVNSTKIFELDKEKDFSEFLGAAYKELNLSYPKFHKMDKLCKLGVLASEVVIRAEKDWETMDKQKIALVFSNASSSLDSDRTHANTIADKNNYFPSPSVFVYTLPNIVIGEIAIKHKITGENAFFISRNFDPQLLFTYGDILMNTTPCNMLLAGWINLDGSNNEGFVYCVKRGNFKEENTDLPLLHTAENIRKLYNS